jgi:hypothetical protein
MSARGQVRFHRHKKTSVSFELKTDRCKLISETDHFDVSFFGAVSGFPPMLMLFVPNLSIVETDRWKAKESRKQIMEKSNH